METEAQKRSEILTKGYRVWAHSQRKHNYQIATPFEWSPLQI